MDNIKLNINNFVNYGSFSAESDRHWEETFVLTTSFSLLEREVLKGTKYINLYGSRGAGKTVSRQQKVD